MRADLAQYQTPLATKSIGSLFARFEGRLKPPQASMEREFIAAVLSVTGVELQTGKVVYNVNTRTICLQVPSLLKSELRFHYQNILDTLSAKVGLEQAPKAII